MRNILVVDDEAIQRRVLGKIIRNAAPSCEVLEAGNGKAALDIVKRTPVDIVFTDIRMPIMDGFELIENLQQLRKGIKIVILSGYRYFEYAQKAIRLGASDFLLKPIREETISDTIKKLDWTLDEERESDMRSEQMKSRLQITLSRNNEQTLHDRVVHGAGEISQEVASYFALRSRAIVLVTDIGPNNHTADNGADYYNRAIGMLNAQLQPLGSAVSFLSKENGRHIVSLVTYEHGFDESLVSTLPAAMIQELDHEAAVVVGVGTERALASDIHESYREAAMALSFRFFLPSEPLLRCERITRLMGALHYGFAKDEDLLKDAIRKGKHEDIIRLVDRLFASALNNGFPPPEQWINAIVHLTLNLSYVVKDFMSEAEYGQLVSEIEMQLRICHDNGEFKQRYADALVRFGSILQAHRSKKHGTVIDKFIAYIDEHHMEDLSLDTVANQLHFSPNYVSALLKNHTGMTFTKLLSDIRIKKAVELLSQSELKIYEIAAKVGFKDEKYFYRVFKGQLGLTPDEFRRDRIK